MFKFIDFFSGIGGFRMGLEENGFIPVGFCENNPNAIKAYTEIYNTNNEYFSNDIKSITGAELPYADIWAFGFPCQDISSQNKEQKGLNGKRSGLFFEVIRLLQERDMERKGNPTILFIENVQRLLQIHRGKDFYKVLQTLDKQGYDVEWRVFNSSTFGVPQNRPRVFLIGYNRKKCKPRPILNTIKPPCNKGTIIYSKWEYNTTFENAKHVFSPEGITRCLLANIGSKKMIETENGVRFFTPLEYLRIQGFPDWVYDKIKDSVPHNQIYCLAGNAVSVPVIKAIGAKIKEYLEKVEYEY